MTETASDKKVLAICLMGPPGSGKGTQAVRLSSKFGIEHLSTGDLLRHEIREESDLGRQAETVINEGHLVPDDIVNEMIRHRLTEYVDQGRGFLLDGYPRTVDQLRYLLKSLEGLEIRIAAFIFLDATPELLVERLMARMVCSECGAVYNAISKRPQRDSVCDKCNGPVGYRGDDNRESIVKRFEVYMRQTQPVLEAIEEIQPLVHVSADRNPEEVFEEIEDRLGGLLA